MKDWTYYKDRAGDFVLVKNEPLTRDIHEAAAPARRGNPRTVELTVVNDRELVRYTKTERSDVPPAWRDALTGAL